jgi:hypothetical protein
VVPVITAVKQDIGRVNARIHRARKESLQALEVAAISEVVAASSSVVVALEVVETVDEPVAVVVALLLRLQRIANLVAGALRLLLKGSHTPSKSAPKRSTGARNVAAGPLRMVPPVTLVQPTRIRQQPM